MSSIRVYNYKNFVYEFPQKFLKNVRLRKLAGISKIRELVVATK